MKKTLVLILGVVLLNSCQSTEEKKKKDELAAKAEEAKCRADFNTVILQYGWNTMQMGLRVGMKKEIDDFQKMQSDTIAKCADLKMAWQELEEKITVKWNVEN